MTIVTVGEGFESVVSSAGLSNDISGSFAQICAWGLNGF